MRTDTIELTQARMDRLGVTVLVNVHCDHLRSEAQYLPARESVWAEAADEARWMTGQLVLAALAVVLISAGAAVRLVGEIAVRVGCPLLAAGQRVRQSSYLLGGG